VRLQLSTAIIAAVIAAFVIFIGLEFAGVVGNEAGRLQPGLLVMLILLMGLLLGDVRRSRRGSRTDA
jgi:hypothetical protein